MKTTSPVCPFWVRPICLLSCRSVMTALTGDLDRYSLIELVGPAGGYGVPWSAVDAAGDRYVIKLIQGFLDPTGEAVARLEMMLARLGEVRSQHVVPIVDAGIAARAAGRLPWIAMPEMPGARSLQQELATGGATRASGWARGVLRDIATGLADLHAVGALHRDLKPGNVLIDRDGRAWLIDFELLKILGVTTRTTRGQEPLGTPVYMAPEQMLGPTLPQSDLWALGLIACELLTGHQPVLDAVVAGHRPERVIANHSLVPAALPAPWPDLVGALLRKIPTSRPASAQLIADWLEDPGAFELPERPQAGRPAARCSLRSLDDVAAVELVAGQDLAVDLDCLDAAATAREQVRRVARAARRLAVNHGVTSPCVEDDQLVLGWSPRVGDGAIARAIAAEAHGDQVLAPWSALSSAGATDLVNDIRITLRHRNLIGDRPLICTVELDAAQLLDLAQRLPLACGLAALRPDGWRVVVRGLQPGCSAQLLRATRDFAQTLASSAACWVHAPGLHRWVLAATPDIGVLYRAGRELWTRQSDGSPRRSDERIEIDVLSGPVPREVAERLHHARPDLVRCSCGICTGGQLPLTGPPTVAHNMAVFAAQDRLLRAQPTGLRPALALQRLHDARARRAALVDVIGWHGELADVDAVLDAIGVVDRTSRAVPPMLQLA